MKLTPSFLLLPRQLLAFTCLLLFPLLGLTASAASTTVVISQVYGGGGNTGATYKNDFIELHNISTSTVSVSGWSVQYASAAGTTWQVTNLTGSIPAGGYFLVQEAAGSGGTTNLPTADGTGSVNMSATAGKVALVSSTTALSGAFLTGTGTGIVDFVGFGTTANTGHEGSGTTPAPSNTTAVARLDSGSTDTDNNAADFTVVAPTPRNSASPTYLPSLTATKVRVETAADGSGTIVAAQSVSVNSSITAYSVSRSNADVFVANPAATWSLTSITGSVVGGDLVPAGDNKSATFTPHAAGSAIIHAVIGGLNSVDSGVISATATPTNPTATAGGSVGTLAPGESVTLTVTIAPGTNPTSTGLAVTGDLSAIGGSSTQALVAGAGNTFAYTAALPANLSYGAKLLNFSVQDAQSRTATASLTLNVLGNLTIFHTNDTHARVTPHKWIIPQHSGNPQTQFEDAGGAAYMGGKLLQLTAAQPDALVLDGGDISEGNPVGDWNGPGNPVGSFGNGTNVAFYQLLDTKLRAIAGRGGRGLDAMVVGNHDIRDISYINNLKNQTNFPVISINICAKGTKTPYFLPYVIVNVNGSKIGIVGYTTETADSLESIVNSTLDVVKCDWSSTDATKIHFADYVNDLRNNQGCNLVILLTHDGHSDLSTASTSGSTPILVDNSVAKLPEIAITGHWHTYADSVWQPTSLNYKTIFTEEGSFMHYVGELRVNGAGKYRSNANYPLRNADITPDPDIAALIQTRKDQYAATNPTYGLDQVIGYSSDDLLLDNKMKWWSSDEYPWSGNNTAGNWICDALQWKAVQLFGQCDLSIESGGGVRSDIPAGPITYTQIYETYPWADDTLYLVKMTGQEILNYFKGHGCDVALSRGWFVTAFDGLPTSITYNGQPIDLSHTYNVAISNYMYVHDSVPFSDPSPTTSTYLNRTALVEYTAQFPQGNPYDAGNSRYSLNTEFAGGYRAVVTMLNDADSSTAFDDAFIRFLDATPETLQHRGTPQVPASLVNVDGSFNPTNRLGEIEAYRSYLGFRTGVLHRGDIIETWGKGSFYQGDPEFVDQEGIQSDGVEFKIVGHDDSLAKPVVVPDIPTALDDWHKNHYIKFLAKKTGTSTVADQNGNALTVEDVTAFSSKTLPGAVNDLLVLTGVPTSESFAMRFRCDTAVLASTLGISSFPPASAATSHVDPVPAGTTNGSLTLTATTAVNPGNVFSLAPLADAQVESGNPANNYNTTNLFVESAASGGFQDERAWLRFDLSSIPAGATITSAKLNMWCWSAAGASLPAEIHGGDSDSWGETTITWNNQPTFGAVLDTQTLAAGVTNTFYTWDATSFAQTKFGGNKLVSLLVKPVTESSTDATAPAYGFDSKEYASNHPYLQVTTAVTSQTTITQVQYFYRYSGDNISWGAWTATGTATSAPYSANFAFPQGYGYYEFYSIATDSNGVVESAPVAAQAATHYTAVPPYTTAAVVTLSNLTQAYDGSPKSATVTTVPSGLAVTVTYDGSSTPPILTTSYAVVATVTSPGFTGTASGTLTITPASQTINFPALPAKNVGDPAFSPGATATSGLAVTYQSDNLAVATVSGGTITIVGAGTANITASQAGNGSYLPAASVSQTLTVNPPASGGTGSDVPLMPWWALALLAGLLFVVATPLLSRKRQTGV